MCLTKCLGLWEIIRVATMLSKWQIQQFVLFNEEKHAKWKSKTQNSYNWATGSVLFIQLLVNMLWLNMATHFNKITHVSECTIPVSKYK